VKSFPPNLIDPEKVWPLEAAFYEKLRNLYRPDVMLLGDKYSLYFSVVRGWTRTLPLHILIGDKYLTAILLPDPLSFFCFVEKESTEAAFAIKAMKFTFRGEVACQGARRILTGKNETLKKANPTGQFPQAFTMQFPDGTPLRTADGKLRKEFITVPFLSFGAYLPCFLHTCVCLFCLYNSACKRAHTMIVHTYSHVTAPPPLRYNNTIALCLNSSVQFTLNVTKSHLIQFSSRYCLY